MFVTKYRPKNLKEYVGQTDAVKTFSEWMRNWKPGKAILFYGPPGVGKTSLLESYCFENRLDLIETNASDFRNSEQLKESIGNSVTQQSLFKRGKILLLDEVDGISGYQDKGGVQEIIRIISESKHPIVLTANNPFDKKLQTLRLKCTLLPFKKIAYLDIVKKITAIASEEKIKIDKEVVQLVAKKSSGDLRSAINDLEIVSKDEKIILSSVAEVGNREREVNIFDALKAIFKTDSVHGAKLSIGNVDKDPDEIFWWIESNIHNEYEDPKEIALAYDALSKADMFRKRIISRQNWKLLTYLIDLMTGGVAVAKKQMYRKFTRYEYPSNIMILGRTKILREQSKIVLKKIGTRLHCSLRKTKSEFLPFIKIFANDEFGKRDLSQYFKLSEDESENLNSILSQ